METTGQWNFPITDVKGVGSWIQHIISGAAKISFGKGPVRTVSTAIFPRGKAKKFSPVFCQFAN